MVPRRGNKRNIKILERYYSQNCKATTLDKMEIMQNITKLMFQAIIIFSDWIFEFSE